MMKKGLTTYGYYATLPYTQYRMNDMDTKTRVKLEAKATVFKALAHSTRLLIVNELEKNERCVSDLTELIGSDQSTVSRHLSVLKNAGIIQDDKRGSLVYYRLCLPCILQVMQCIESSLNTSAEERIALTK